nr:hypothetical protein [Streptomyces sp. TLI_235]
MELAGGCGGTVVDHLVQADATAVLTDAFPLDLRMGGAVAVVLHDRSTAGPLVGVPAVDVSANHAGGKICMRLCEGFELVWSWRCGLAPQAERASRLSVVAGHGGGQRLVLLA